MKKFIILFVAVALFWIVACSKSEPTTDLNAPADTVETEAPTTR